MAFSAPPERSPQWLDSMYNNRALVPDHADWFDRWAERSAAVRAGGWCETDVPYGAGQEKLDVFAPRKTSHAGSPVLVFIHGGYWRSMDKSGHSFIAQPFADEGFCVVVPGYELCPAVTIPGIALQMVRALAWTYRNIARWGGDPTRITVAGHSAGGHLATMLLLCRWQDHAGDLPARLVRNALSVSGLFDLAPLMHTPFLQDSLRLTPEQVLQASPALLPPPPPGAVLYGVAGGNESAEFLRQNALIEKAWGPAAVPVCRTLDGLHHFSILQTLAQPESTLNRLALELLLAPAAGNP